MPVDDLSVVLGNSETIDLNVNGTFRREDFLPRAAHETADGCGEFDLDDLEVDGAWDAHSRVRKAVHRPTGALIALKTVAVYHPARCNEFVHGLRARAVAPPCPYRVRVHGAVADGTSVHMLLEFMDRGSLSRVIQTYRAATGHGILHEPTLCSIAEQLLGCLEAMAAEARSWRTKLTPSRVLLSTDGSVKLADTEHPALQRGIEHRIIGMPRAYLPPEEMTGDVSVHGEEGCPRAAADVWALGLLLLECIRGGRWYAAEDGAVPNYFELLVRIIEGELPSVPPDAPLSDELFDFVKACLQREPSARPTVAELRAHAWIRAAGRWSPATHACFPRRVRTRAVRLLVLGHLLAADEARFGPGAAALGDIFVAHVLPHALRR